jgi:hypothetical protein
MFGIFGEFSLFGLFALFLIVAAISSIGTQQRQEHERELKVRAKLAELRRAGDLPEGRTEDEILYTALQQMKRHSKLFALWLLGALFLFWIPACCLVFAIATFAAGRKEWLGIIVGVVGASLLVMGFRKLRTVWRAQRDMTFLKFI